MNVELKALLTEVNLLLAKIQGFLQTEISETRINVSDKSADQIVQSVDRNIKSA